MKKRGSWQSYLLRVIADEETGMLSFFIRVFLSSLEFIYLILSRLKYRTSRRRQLPVPVISVGNITVGGTGKTPTVVWLVKLLKEAGFNPAVLTRGYNRKHPQDSLSFSSSAAADLNAVMTGDEPFLLAKLLPDTLIVVGRERYQNGLKALTSKPAINLFILDDGFQHWNLARDLDIIIIDATCPFSNHHLLPRGLLREPLASLKRAEVILLTRSAKVSQDVIQDLTRQMLAINPKLAIATISEDNSQLISLSSWARRQNNETISAANFLKGRRVSAITGIGNPRQFLASLENLGAEVGYFKAYPDHYYWEEAEIIDLVTGLSANGFSQLIVTAKDGVKLEPWATLFDKYHLQCYILGLDFSVSDHQVIEKIKTAARQKG